MEPFGVKLPEFEGPLDLLLHLVRKEKLDIREVPVSLVAHQYLQYLRRMAIGDLGLLAEYLLMAATLLYLKSKALLPEPDQQEAEELQEQITRRLIHYDAFQAAAQQLERRPLLGRDVFTRGPMPLEEESEGEIQADLSALLEAAKRVLRAKPLRPRPMRPPQGFDLKRKMEELLQRLKLLGRLRLDPHREILPLFMASLELAKQGAVSLFQEEPFGPLWIALRWEGLKEEAAS